MKKKVQQYVSKYLMQMSNCNCMFLHISKKIIIGLRYQCYSVIIHMAMKCLKQLNLTKM